MSGFMFEVGKAYETQEGHLVSVVGRTGAPGYETLICSDCKHRYDRSTHSNDAGRVTGTRHNYTHRCNFKRKDKPNQCWYAADGTLMGSDGKRSIFDDVDE
jgi:hypothetical protein